MSIKSFPLLSVTLLLLLSISKGDLVGQDITRSVISVAGGDYMSTNASLNWTLGEIAIETLMKY